LKLHSHPNPLCPLRPWREKKGEFFIPLNC